VDDLLPHVVFNPSLLLRHYKSFNSEWTLEEITKATMKRSLLEEASLIHRIKLRVSTYRNQGLRPLTILPHPHQLKSLELSYHYSASPFSIDDFIDSLKSLAPTCTELKSHALSVKSSDRQVDWPRNPLKKVELVLSCFSAFFNSGILNSITSLHLLHDVHNFGITQGALAYRPMLDNLPSMLSQLPCLYELRTYETHGDKQQLKGLPKVHSTSLRSLHASGYLSEPDSEVLFLGLFTDCLISSIGISADLLDEAIRLFPNIQYLRIWVSPDTLSLLESY